MEYSSNILDLFLKNVPPNSKILDIGAGDGFQSNIFSKNGHRVYGVDLKSKPPKLSPEIEWLEIPFEKIISKKDFNQMHWNGIFMRNVLQFFTHEFVTQKLVPWIDAHLLNDGIVAIETFYKPPLPPLTKPVSYWSIKELSSMFPDWKFINCSSQERDGNDMSGNKRRFFLSQVVLQKIT